MTATADRPKARKARAKAVERVDVLVVGAGISGVGAAWHLTHQRPGARFVVLEEKDTFGGTWVTHKYPGIRSDSDLYTFGYRFKPWVGPPIATAEEILSYMREVIAESGLDRHIRYRRRVTHAAWSSKTQRWTVDVLHLDTGETSRIEAGFLWMCQGYYRHDKGYTPDWPGMADYAGRIVHPQTWPDDLDLTGKQVLVIGSGATAATVVPNIAGKCAHVTLLQRSPTYFIPARNANDLADQLRLLQVDPAWIHEITRKRILYDQQDFTRRCREEPKAVTAELLAAVEMFLGKDYDIARHFTPHYRPWRQRIAFIPDGDLFVGIAQGKATVVTDEIDRFTREGVRLKSGSELKADVIVTATGFDLSVMGDIPFEVDGEAVDWAKTVTYRGMMFTGVPNLAWVFGYFRASWTLRVDMMGDFICRLLAHMHAHGRREVRVALRPEDHNMPIGPWVDEEDFNPGYLLRMGHLLPRAGDKPEWRHTQDYWIEKDLFPKIDLAGEEFVYR
jgi:cation diffusion facilitator CzcD-associated flavoprotein CzcO